MFLQEVLSRSSTVNISVEKPRQDGQSSGKSRGWLNWLSRGMLGAGGTDDSSQFSGIVSDEDVQVLLVQDLVRWKFFRSEGL